LLSNRHRLLSYLSLCLLYDMRHLGFDFEVVENALHREVKVVLIVLQLVVFY
jgi:hypothetical protein